MREAISRVFSRVHDVLSVAPGVLLAGSPLALWSLRPEGDALMKLTNNMGMLLLGIYLIAIGLVRLLNISLGGLGLLLPILAIAAGVLIWLGR